MSKYAEWKGCTCIRLIWMGQHEKHYHYPSCPHHDSQYHLYRIRYTLNPLTSKLRQPGVITRAGVNPTEAAITLMQEHDGRLEVVSVYPEKRSIVDN